MYPFKEKLVICLLSSIYIFDPRSGWMRLPDMNTTRSHVMCGLVTDREGNKKIVIAGGYSE